MLANILDRLVIRCVIWLEQRENARASSPLDMLK
jgi:hypothetical protein